MMLLVWIMGAGLCIVLVMIVAENIYSDFLNNNKKTNKKSQDE